MVLQRFIKTSPELGLFLVSLSGSLKWLDCKVKQHGWKDNKIFIEIKLFLLFH